VWVGGITENRGAYSLAARSAAWEPGLVVKVLTVDDHTPFLEVARDLVETTPGFESAGEVATAADALAQIEREPPDLALVDVHMPDMNGIELAQRLKASPHPPVVVLISAVDPANLPAAAGRCGAAAVISKHELAPSRLRELWSAHGAAATQAAGK
jgi:two-component system, NarL family, invasion response regulator UvrY